MIETVAILAGNVATCAFVFWVGIIRGVKIGRGTQFVTKNCMCGHLSNSHKHKRGRFGMCMAVTNNGNDCACQQYVSDKAMIE